MIAAINADKIPSMEMTRSLNTNIPKTMVAASMMKIKTGLLIFLKILQSTKAMISVPPVEPPPMKVRAHPAPTKKPPAAAATIRESSP